MKRRYDIVVIGAGPAGAKTAETASRQGAGVLLVDQKRRPGHPVQCAEHVPTVVRDYVRLAPGAVVQKTDRMLTFIGDRLVSSLRAPGYMLNRQAFDEGLVRQAQAAGAELQLGARAAARTDSGVIITRGGIKEEIDCAVIIGADGPRSTVGRWMSSQNRDFLVAIQYRMPLSWSHTATEFYFSPEYQEGYAWLFPKRDTANVGVGIRGGNGPLMKRLLAGFIRRLVEEGRLKDDVPLGQTGGAIPVGGPLAVTQKDNMLLVGDAAGHTHPITGGGVMSALVGGEIAGRLAAEAVKQNNLTLLAEYQPRWQAVMGGYLMRASLKRDDFDRNWTDDPRQFDLLIRRTWIGLSI